jgi:signal transduction histidine kinase
MRQVVTGVALVGFGMLVFEVIMDPNGTERISALVLFGLLAGGIAFAGYLLPRLARRLPSLKVTVVLLGLTAVLILVLAAVIAGRQMFITTHDLSLFLVFLGFGVVAALALGLNVGGPLTEDLARISETSSAIAAGDLGARTDVDRHDEAGQLARDVDVMAGALQTSEAARIREEEARRASLAAISHDLRTPLASMRVAVEALHDGLVEEPGRYLDSLEADIEALSRLVDDVFLLARLETGDIDLDVEEVDLTEIADEAIEVFRPIAISRGVTLRLEADARVLALGSAQALSRVVRNLIDNAIRHSPTPGEVIVAVGNGTGALCRVTDQGAGFSPGFVASAFERFSRDDRSRGRDLGGAGLGLAIARGYVNALNGRIWALPGPGGSVSFWLPSASPEPSDV